MNQIHLAVKGVSQDLDFLTGSQVNFVILQLPSGQVFRAAIEDEVAQLIISAATNGASTASFQSELDTSVAEEELHRLKTEAAAQDQMRMVEDDAGQTLMDFGGDVSDEERAYGLDPPQEKLSHEQVMKGKNVASHLVDEMGNLTSVPGKGVDPGEVVASDDEDGTPSI